MATEADAVDVATEHHVQDGDVIGEAGPEGLDRLLTAQGDVDRDAGLSQPASETAGDLRFVLDDEYTHARHRMQRSRPAPASRVTRYLLG